METFADIYTKQSPGGIFGHADTVFVLAYSTIMLNTDLHNPQVKTKMTVEQFISNNKGEES
jgi:brefeldin A-inhibited guanine nucleotide-exchange protein